mmetsp:Transcript_653/g.1025  ORF Transcript_653/g.1025 Transcript_653/m.1025 type:complete len:264 (+) Transcript_653:60-851(+)
MHPPRRRPHISAKLAPLHSARVCGDGSSLEAAGNSCFPPSDSFCTVVQQRVAFRRRDRAQSSVRSRGAVFSGSQGEALEDRQSGGKRWVFDVVEIRGADGAMYRLFPPQHTLDNLGTRLIADPSVSGAVQPPQEDEVGVKPEAGSMSPSLAHGNESCSDSTECQPANQQEPLDLVKEICLESQGTTMVACSLSALAAGGVVCPEARSEGGWHCNPQCGDGPHATVCAASQSAEAAESIAARMGRLPLGRQRELLNLLEELECV